MYVKLFASIYQGTLRGDSNGLLVFTNLLAHCDSEGFVDIHPRAIADEVGLPADAVRAALDRLEAPDPESRTPDENGRRIVRVSDHRAWGWVVVNYAKYRSIRNEDDRRAANRDAVARHRAKKRAEQSGAITVMPVINVSRGKPRSSQGEGEGDGDKTNARPPSPRKRGSPFFGAFWTAWPKHQRKVAREQCMKKWAAAGCDEIADQIMSALEAAKKSRAWSGGDFVPSPLVWLNQARWEAPIEADVLRAASSPSHEIFKPAPEMSDEERAAADEARRRVMSGIRKVS